MASALLVIGVAAMPAIVRHVGGRDFPDLQEKRGGGWAGSLVTAGGAGVLFALAWCATLPLCAAPPLALAAHLLLWGALTRRVMSYDALAGLRRAGA